MSFDPTLTSSIVKTVAFNDYTVSAVALLYYDWFLTFDEEVEFIWKQRWGWGKILYIMNRFVPMIDLLILAISYSDITLKPSMCRPWWFIDTWLSILNFLVMDVVLLLRTWALWNRDRKILAVLIISLVVSGLSAGGASLYASLVVQTDIASVDNIRPCGSSFPDVKPLYGIWAGLMFYDTVVMLLILYKAIPVFLMMPLSPTLKTFFQDGFIYYIIIFVAAFANILMISFAPGELATTLFTFHRSMSSLLGSRMILNLRGIILRPSAFAQFENGEFVEGSFGLGQLSDPEGTWNRVGSASGRDGCDVRSTRGGNDLELMDMDLNLDRSLPGLPVDEDEDDRPRPRSAGTLVDAVQVRVSTAVKWEDDSQFQPAYFPPAPP